MPGEFDYWCSFTHLSDILNLTLNMSLQQARVLAHLEGLMTFSPNFAAAAGGQFDDVDDEGAEGAGSSTGGEGGGAEDGQGEGEGGMNGHNGSTAE